jgi:hypothetical protein
MTVAQLAQLFPDGSGNIKMENFVPAYYLLEQHRGATLDELRTGLKHMKAQSRVADEGPRDVIKHNLHSFMTCIDALYAARESLGEAKTGIGWPLTARMESLVRFVSLTHAYLPAVHRLSRRTTKPIHFSQRYYHARILLTRREMH